jgi:PAS domain S-box-containing protein
MSEILVPLTSEYTLIIPGDVSAKLAWVIGFMGIIVLAYHLRDRSFKLDRPRLLWLAVLSVLILILTPFVGLLPRMSSVLGTGEVPIKHLMFFAAIPWMVAGGVLGILPAVLLGGISGLLLAYLDTHNIFTPLVMMSVALVFSWCVRQRFRTAMFKWLRFPLIAATGSIVATAPLVFLVLIFSGSGSTATKVAMAMNRYPAVMFSLAGMVMIGGAASMIVQAAAQQRWGNQTTLRPAPGEVYFRYRLLGYAVPIFIIVLAGVLLSAWSVAQSQARQQMVGQLRDTTGMAAESLDLFLETGERLALDLAREAELNSGSAEQVTPLLNLSLESTNFFDGLALFDIEGNFIAGVPEGTPIGTEPLLERAELELFFSNTGKTQIFFSSGQHEEQDGLVVFGVSVGEQPADAQRLLWAYASLNRNRYARPFITAMKALTAQGGGASIMGNDGTVLYQLGAGESVARLPGTNFTTATYYQSTTTDGGTLAHYFQPIEGAGWGVAATMPAQVAQEIAWEMTRSLLLITAAVMVLVFLGVWLGMSPVVKEMETMAVAINAVVVGDVDLEHLDLRLDKQRGYFKAAFKNMIALQKKRLDRQEKLLSVSGRVAGQLNLGESLHMILSSALMHGVSGARIVISDADRDEISADAERRFGVGQHARLLAPLDQAVASLAQKGVSGVFPREEVVKKFSSLEGMPDLTALVIIPLKWKDQHLGVFWVSFSDSPFPEDEVVNFLNELAQVANMAIINAKTYRDSQFSSALLGTIFDLLPDAVLIVDQQQRVLFHNVSAQDLFGIGGEGLAGKTLSALFMAADLVKLNLGADQNLKSEEVHLSDGKAYEVILSPLSIPPAHFSTAMIFKDLTQQKKSESLKTEFVTTVSHELRSPLTLILGYAKILRLTGNLNEQQDTYIGNIIDGVEEMKDLVQKLLDIGRLEGGESFDIRQFTAEQITNRVVESLDAQAKQKNIEVTVILPDDVLLIEGDQTFLTQALKNLLENAIKFSKMEGEVTVSVREKDGRVIFAIQDKGIGIAPLDQRNLFKKFSRISAHAGIENEGSGLGLAIVKSIAERHGGEVRLESQLGRGSTFYFEIPCKQSS